MPTLTIRKLPEDTKRRLRIRAAHHGRSMEEEAREILRKALIEQPAEEADLGARIHGRFAALGVLELPEPARDPIRDPVDLGS